jgi:hypothetical protein
VYYRGVGEECGRVEGANRLGPVLHSVTENMILCSCLCTLFLTVPYFRMNRPTLRRIIFFVRVIAFSLDDSRQHRAILTTACCQLSRHSSSMYLLWTKISSSLRCHNSVNRLCLEPSPPSAALLCSRMDCCHHSNCYVCLCEGEPGYLRQ